MAKCILYVKKLRHCVMIKNGTLQSQEAPSVLARVEDLADAETVILSSLQRKELPLYRLLYTTRKSRKDSKRKTVD